MSRSSCIGAALLFGLALMVLSARAVEPTTSDGGKVIYPRSSDTKNTSTSNAKTGNSTGLLTVALLMAGAGGWLYWRGRRSASGAPVARNLAIAETKALGNRQYLVVASYQDKKFLLGVCPGRIELLTPLDDRAGPSRSS